MRSLKLLSLTTCCLALSVATAQAQPKALSDAELDNVVAGFTIIFPGDAALGSGTGFPSFFARLFAPPQPEVLNFVEDEVQVSKSVVILPNGNGNGGIKGDFADARLTAEQIEAGRQEFMSRERPPSYPQFLLPLFSR